MEPDDPAGVGQRTMPPISRSSFALIAVAVIALLFAVYWLYLRESYTTILRDIEPDVAADVVRTLEARKIPYRLTNGGRDVQVVEEEADKARVELVGSELPMRGQVGFEIFNQSDMGLTEFDQKISYLRALQGELARTILMLDGISQVRVHLGLAERTVFAADRERPRASITIALKPGSSLTESRVSGIQRLVAGAVPDMHAEDVAVLDATGRVLSNSGATALSAGQDPVADGYRAKASALLAELYPAMNLTVEVSLTTGATPAGRQPVGTDSKPDPDGKVPRTLVGVRVMTKSALTVAQGEDIRTDVVNGLGLDPVRGDTVQIIQQANAPAPAPAVADMAADRVVAQRPEPVERQQKNFWAENWPLIALAVLMLLLVASWNDRRRTRVRQNGELTAFADELNRRLAAAGENQR